MPTYAVSPGPTGKPPKHDWREVYDILVELRKDRTAPVDWAGSDTSRKWPTSFISNINCINAIFTNKRSNG